MFCSASNWFICARSTTSNRPVRCIRLVIWSAATCSRSLLLPVKDPETLPTPNGGTPTAAFSRLAGADP